MSASSASFLFSLGGILKGKYCCRKNCRNFSIHVFVSQNRCPFKVLPDDFYFFGISSFDLDCQKTVLEIFCQIELMKEFLFYFTGFAFSVKKFHFSVKPLNEFQQCGVLTKFWPKNEFGSNHAFLQKQTIKKLE